MAQQPGNFNLQEFTDLGDLAVGGRLYTYSYGTTTFKTAYTDQAGVVPHTYTSDGSGGQYIALNARGEIPAPLYLSDGSSYDITLKTAAGATVWTRRADNFYGLLGIDLAASTGGTLVGVIQSEGNSVARTVTQGFRRVYYLEDSTGLAAAIASGRKIMVKNGTYTVPTGSAITARTEIEGESRDGVILEGTGDLFDLTSINSSLVLSNLTLQNSSAGTRGKLVKVTYSTHLIQSVFRNVHFKKALNHIHTDRGFGESCVDWLFDNCRFIDASDISRKYGAMWVLKENNCYSWYNNKAISFNGNVYTNSIIGSTFELNGLEAIKLNLVTNTNIYGLLFQGCHFESNGQTTPSSPMVIDGDPATAVIQGLTFDTCISVAETANPTVSLPTPSNITNFSSVAFINSPLITSDIPVNGSLWTSTEYRTGKQFSCLGKVVSITGFDAGNNVTQAGPIALVVGESHRVVVREAANSSGAAVGFYQEYIVGRNSYGTITVNTIVNTAPGGDGCVISTATPNYSVKTGSAMTHTIIPYIDISRI